MIEIFELVDIRCAASPPTKGSVNSMQRSGIALIGLTGVLSRDGEHHSFGKGTSTDHFRADLQAAVDAPDVKAIVVLANSPGGAMAGTQDATDAVAAAARKKPVYFFAQDLMASAAYHIATPATKIYAAKSSFIGSIGVYSVLLDASKLAERSGIKVHVIRAGDFKGMAEFGTEITAEHVAEIQRLINASNNLFLAAVSSGRKLSGPRLSAVSDGRAHTAADAKALGLVDEIASLEEVLGEVVKLYGRAPEVARAQAKVKPLSLYEQCKIEVGIAQRAAAQDRAKAAATPPAKPRASAAERFDTALRTELAKGHDRSTAVRIVARRNPALYESYREHMETR